MGALEVQPFPGGIGGDKDADFLVLPEAFFHLAAFVPHHAAVNDGNGFFTAQQGTDLVCQVAQGVAVFGKEDELFPKTLGIKHALFVLQEAGKLFPLAV